MIIISLVANVKSAEPHLTCVGVSRLIHRSPSRPCHPWGRWPSSLICHFHRIPEDVQVTWGLGTRCRQRMPPLSIRTAVTQRLDCMTFKKSLEGALDLHEWASWQSSLCQHLMNRSKAMSTPGPDARDFLTLKRRREGVMKRNKLQSDF